MTPTMPTLSRREKESLPPVSGTFFRRIRYTTRYSGPLSVSNTLHGQKKDAQENNRRRGITLTLPFFFVFSNFRLSSSPPLKINDPGERGGRICNGTRGPFLSHLNLKARKNARLFRILFKGKKSRFLPPFHSPLISPHPACIGTA